MKKTITAAMLAVGFAAMPLMAQEGQHQYPPSTTVQSEHHTQNGEHRTQTTTTRTTRPATHRTKKHFKRHRHMKKVVTKSHTHIEEHRN